MRWHWAGVRRRRKQNCQSTEEAALAGSSVLGGARAPGGDAGVRDLPDFVLPTAGTGLVEGGLLAKLLRLLSMFLNQLLEDMGPARRCCDQQALASSNSPLRAANT